MRRLNQRHHGHGIGQPALPALPTTVATSTQRHHHHVHRLHGRHFAVDFVFGALERQLGLCQSLARRFAAGLDGCGPVSLRAKRLHALLRPRHHRHRLRPHQHLGHDGHVANQPFAQRSPNRALVRVFEWLGLWHGAIDRRLGGTNQRRLGAAAVFARDAFNRGGVIPNVAHAVSCTQRAQTLGFQTTLGLA